MTPRIILLALALLAFPAATLAQQPSEAPAQTSEELRDEAFRSAQTAMLTSASMALAQLGVRFAAGSDELARSVRERQDLVAAWKAADRALVQAMSTSDDTEDPMVRGRRAEADALQARIEASDRDMAARFPAYAELSQPRPMSIAATQALLGEDEALVLVFVATRETFVWVVTPTGADWQRVPASRKELVAEVKSLRAGLDPGAVAVMRSGALRDFGDSEVEGVATSERTGFSRATAHDLFQKLLAPLDGLLAKARRVYVVAERPFDSIPFALLVTQPPQGEDTDPAALRETAWLIKRQGVVTLPSVSSLKSLRAAVAAAPAALPFRGYGAPLLGGQHEAVQVASATTDAAGTMLRGGRVDLETVRSLAPLPQTEGELRKLAEALGAPQDSVQVGAAATKSAVQAADLSNYRVLAFATHGLLAGDIAGLAEPALVFTPPETVQGTDDGLLTASEAARLNLSADWVILSACNTAGGDGTPGADGLSGLARAFFYAGARTLLVSHWPVRDDAAARLTTGTLSVLRTEPGLAKAEAFRRATLALIADTSDPTLAHPAIWAPFVMVGEGK